MVKTMAKKESKKVTKKENCVMIDKKLIDVGNLFSSLGSVDRNSGESFILIKDTEIKTTGNGIFAKYQFDSIGLPESFVPMDSKMFFSREEGNYEFKINKSNIEVMGNGRKSTIPFVTFDEWTEIEKKNDYASLIIPSNAALEKYISYKQDDIICKFKLFKDDLTEIKKYQSYLGHKGNEEQFELIKKDDSTILILIKDDQKNFKAEEIEISEGVEINKIKETIKVVFSPKYLISDDYDVVVFTNENSDGKKITFEGINNKIMFFTSVEDLSTDILDDQMNDTLADIDEDFGKEDALDDVDQDVKEEFESFGEEADF